MQEALNQLGLIVVSLIDNPLGGYASWAVITGAVAWWTYSGGPPPTDGPQPLPQ